MNIYRNSQRLKADDYLDKGHISVRRSIKSDYQLHWHDYFEIEIIAQGSGTHIFNGTEYPISKGDAYLLTPVDFHEIRVNEPMEIINISFDELWLTEKVQEFLYSPFFEKWINFDEQALEQIISAAALLRNECENEGLCVGQLLEYMLSRFVGSKENRPQKVVNQDAIKGIKEAISHIELHFREKITLKQLSELSGYNPSYFSDLFRKVTGSTYIERLTSLRINYAKMLLANGISVSDACFASGFGSLSNFLSIFKQRCNVTPSEYRKKHNKPTYQ